MWTSTTQLKASYAGIEFLVGPLKGKSGRKLVENQIPYRAGSTFEDMSRIPYRCSFTAIFTGNSAVPDAQSLFDIINGDDLTPQTFRHPIWGDIIGILETMDDDIDPANEDYVELTCSFVEDNGQFFTRQSENTETLDSINSDLSDELSKYDDYIGSLP